MMPAPQLTSPRAAEEIFRPAAALPTGLADQPRRRAIFQDGLGRTYLALGLPPEAIIQEEKSREYFIETRSPGQRDTLGVMHTLANSYSDVGRRDEALQLREPVLELPRKLLGPEHPYTLGAMTNLAISYRLVVGFDKRRFTAARPTARRQAQTKSRKTP